MKLVGNAIRLAVAVAWGRGGRFQIDKFRFKQRRLIPIRGNLRFPTVVLHQRIGDLVVTDQVEALLLVDRNHDGRLLLTFGPDVELILRGLILDRVDKFVWIWHRLIRQRRVNDCTRVFSGARNQDTLGVDFVDLAVADLVLDHLERAGIDDGDFAHAVRGDVDTVQHQSIRAVVVDIDRRESIGHLELPVAGAENPTGQRDRPTLRYDLLDYDRLLVWIPVAVHLELWIGRRTEANAGQRVSIAVAETRDRARRNEAGVDDQLDRVGAALDQPVDVQVSGRDVDSSQSENRRLFFDDRVPESWHLTCIGVSSGRTTYRERSVSVIVDELTRILVGVEPVVGVEIEVALSPNRYGPRPNLPQHIDATLLIVDRQRPVFIDDVTVDVDVLRNARQSEAQVVLDLGVRVLQDINVRIGFVRVCVYHEVIQINVTRLEDDQFITGHGDGSVLIDDGVVDRHRKRRLVEYVDHRPRPGDDPIGVDVRYVGSVRRIRLDEYRAGRSDDIRDVQEQCIQFRIDQVVFVDQPQIVEGLVDGGQLDGVASDGFGISGVASHPADDGFPLLDQQVTHVGVRKRGHVDLDRLDNVELIGKSRFELVGGVTAIDGRSELGPPGRVGENLAVEDRNRSGRGANVPIQFVGRGPNDLICSDGNVVSDGSRGSVMSDRQRDPLGRGIVLILQNEFVAAGERVYVIGIQSAGAAAVVVAGDNLHDGALGDVKADLFRIKQRNLVVEVQGKVQISLLGIGQRDRARLQLTQRNAVRRIQVRAQVNRLHVEQCLVVQPGLDVERRPLQIDGVGDVDADAVGHFHAVRHQRDRQRQPVGNAVDDPSLGFQVDVFQRFQGGGSGYGHRVVEIDLGRHDRYDNAGHERVGDDFRVGDRVQ